MSKQTVKDILRFAVGVGILALIQEIVILILVFGFGQFNDILVPLLLGTVYGSVYVILSFAHMGYAVEKCLEKEEKQAQLYMQTRYTLRMLVMVVVMVAAAYIPFVNIYTALIPLAFTRIVATLMGARNKKRG